MLRKRSYPAVVTPPVMLIRDSDARLWMLMPQGAAPYVSVRELENWVAAAFTSEVALGETCKHLYTWAQNVGQTLESTWPTME